MVVIGAGAIGSFLAARLCLAGESLMLVVREGQLRSLRRDGLQVRAEGLPRRIVVPVAADLDSARPASLVLLCTKMADLAAALDRVAPVIGPQTALLTVQNGVEAPDLVRVRYPAATVLASRVHGFFERSGGIVHHVGVAPSLELGALTPDPDGQAPAVADRFNRAGIATRLSPDIAASLWSKFLLAAPLGGVALATGLAAGAVSRDARARAMLEAAMGEVRDLAVARGIALGPDIVVTTMAFAATFPAEATTSLQRDVLRGSLSEYAFLPAAVSRLGRESGIPTPCFDRINALVSERFGTFEAGCS